MYPNLVFSSPVNQYLLVVYIYIYIYMYIFLCLYIYLYWDGSIVLVLRQKLANQNMGLGCGWNEHCGAATAKSYQDTCVCWNLHLSVSASWFVGELECRCVGLLLSCSVINWSASSVSSAIPVMCPSSEVVSVSNVMSETAAYEVAAL